MPQVTVRDPPKGHEHNLRRGRGRPPGAKNKMSTKEKRDIKAKALKFLTDPEYNKQLLKRLRSGTAGQMEILLYHYAYGKPKEQGLGEGDLQKQLDRLRAEANKALKAAKRQELPPSRPLRLIASGIPEGDVVDAERA